MAEEGIGMPGMDGKKSEELSLHTGIQNLPHDVCAFSEQNLQRHSQNDLAVANNIQTLEEEPYAAVLRFQSVFGKIPAAHSFLESRCSSCFKPATRACTRCSMVRYCHSECQRNDWPIHKFECKAYQQLGTDSRFLLNYLQVRLIGRIVARQLVEDQTVKSDGKSDVIWDETPRNKLKDIRELDPVLKEDPSFCMDLAGIISKFRQMFRFTDISYKINDNELCNLFAMVWYNAFTIYENTEKGTRAIGLGLYLNACCLPHSCDPDYAAHFYGPKLKLRLVKPNALLQPITKRSINFVFLQEPASFQDHSIVPLHIRRDFFKYHHFKQCKCHLCVNQEREDLFNYSTTKLCRNPACGPEGVTVVLKNGEELRCYVCGTIVRQSPFVYSAYTAIKEVQKCVNLSIFGMEGATVEKYLRETYEKAEKYLHPKMNGLFAMQLEHIFADNYNACISYFTARDDVARDPIPGTIPIAKALEFGLKLYATYETWLNPRKEHAFGELAIKIANLYRWNGNCLEKKEWLLKGMKAFAVRFGQEHSTVNAVQKLMFETT